LLSIYLSAMRVVAR